MNKSNIENALDEKIIVVYLTTDSYQPVSVFKPSVNGDYNFKLTSKYMILTNKRCYRVRYGKIVFDSIKSIILKNEIKKKF